MKSSSRKQMKLIASEDFDEPEIIEKTESNSPQNTPQPVSFASNKQDEYLYDLIATYIADALHGRSIKRNTDKLALKLYWGYHSHWWRRLFALLCVLQLSIVTYYEPVGSCTTKTSQSKIQTSMAWANLLILCFFLADLGMNTRVRGWRNVCRNKWFWLSCICMILQLVDSLSSLFGLQCLFSRGLRPLFVLSRFFHVRAIASCIMRSMPKLFAIGVILTLHLVVFAFFGTLLFRDFTEPYAAECEIQTLNFERTRPDSCIYPNAGGVEREDYFETIPEGMLNLFILLTTANYPDVMMPYYRQAPTACIFFVVFLVIGLFFLLNLVLAVVYEDYKRHSIQVAARRISRRQTAFKTSFDLLVQQSFNVASHRVGFARISRRQRVDKEICLYVMHYVKPNLDARICQILFEIVAEGDDTPTSFSNAPSPKNSSNSIKKQSSGENSPAELSSMFYKETLNQAQFQHLFQLAIELTAHLVPRPLHDLEFHDEREANWWHRLRSTAAAVVSHRFFETTFDFLVLMSITAIFLEISACRDGCPHVHVFLNMEYVFLGIFCVEMALKLLGLGPRLFWESTTNRFDLLAVAMSLISITVISPKLATQSDFHPRFGRDTNANYRIWTPVLMMLRFGRIFRVLVLFPAFNLVLTSAKQMIPALARLTVVIYLLYYAYAIFGMEIFATSAWDMKSIKNSPFAQSLYYENNFENIARAMLFLFELTVVNNWHILMTAAVESLESSMIVFYFVTFYVMSVLIVSNVVVAFIVDTFVTEYEHHSQEGETSRQRLQRQVDEFHVRRDDYNARFNTWKVTPTRRFSGVYKNVFATHLFEQAQEKIQEQARQDELQDITLQVVPIIDDE